MTEYKHYRSNPLFIAGLMLYIGEGDNTGTRLIRLANIKIDIHRIFIGFLRNFLVFHVKRYVFGYSLPCS